MITQTIFRQGIDPSPGFPDCSEKLNQINFFLSSMFCIFKIPAWFYQGGNKVIFPWIIQIYRQNMYSSETDWETILFKATKCSHSYTREKEAENSCYTIDLLSKTEAI